MSNDEKLETPETISIAGKKYKANSVTETGANIATDLKKVEEDIQRRKADVFISELARAKLIDLLLNEAENFEEVPGVADNTIAVND